MNMLIILVKKPTLHVPLSLGIQKNAQSKSKLWRTKLLYAHSWSMRPHHGRLTPNVTLIKSRVQRRDARATLNDWSRPKSTDSQIQLMS